MRFHIFGTAWARSALASCTIAASPLRPCFLLPLLLLLVALPMRFSAGQPLLVVGAAADIQYEDREPGPFPDDVRRFYNTSHLRLDEMVAAWNADERIDLVMHLGDLINAQWESYDVVLDYADGTDYDPNLLTFRDLNAPSYQVLGNHEFYQISDVPHPEGHDDLHVRERLGLANNLGYYAISPVEGFRFLVLDDQVPEANTQRFEDSFGLGERRSTYFSQQMLWVRRMIADAWKAGEKVVLFEHYPMSRYYNDRELNPWEAELAQLIETYPNVVAHFSGHFHDGPGSSKDGVLFETLGGTVSANPDLDQNLWYVLEFYDDHVVVDQFGWNVHMQPDQDDKSFYFRDHTAAPSCLGERDCLDVAFADVDGDGDVTEDDLARWEANYGNSASQTLQLGDISGDRMVHGEDFLAWQKQLPARLASPTALLIVPEPGSWVLAGLLVPLSCLRCGR